MKHTWIIDEADDAETTISGLRQPERGFFKQEDARLICAAPDLLEACKAALRHWYADESLGAGTSDDGEIARILREAIAKVENADQ